MAIDDDSLDFDLLAASLRADATDLHAFIDVIATKMEAALPGATSVKRVKQGFRGPKIVVEVAVEAGGERLELHRQGDALESMRAKTSGGIVLKRERLDINQWLESLAQMLAVEAKRSQLTREALGRLLDV
jgi:hypothetical protein